MDKIFVKTVYEPKHMREPNISEYDTKKEADAFIEMCLQWGIGIVSCHKIPKEEAHNNPIQPTPKAGG